MLKVVVIGGGTGTFTVLSGLKKQGVKLYDVVSMTDSGGSNKIIRDEHGLLPTSDIVQGMIALADSDKNDLVRNLVSYRFTQGGQGTTGMRLGNLILAALTDIYGSQEVAIQKLAELLDIQGEVIPVTFDYATLYARYENGHQVVDEHAIDEPRFKESQGKLIELSLIPVAKANPLAVKAIMNADMVVIGPGDLFTSLICNLVVDGIADAVSQTKATLVYVGNLMGKFGQTENLTAAGHVDTLSSYIGRAPDWILVHDTINYPFPDEILERYVPERAAPVIDDLGDAPNVIRADLASAIVHEKNKADHLKRSLIRHDADKLADVIMNLP